MSHIVAKESEIEHVAMGDVRSPSWEGLPVVLLTTHVNMGMGGPCLNAEEAAFFDSLSLSLSLSLSV
jgi:hypothetical protein